jgi:hypothetical protein
MPRFRLAIEIFVAYVLARWWLIRLDVPSAVAAARRVSSRSAGRPLPVVSAARLGWGVHRALKPLPFDSRCLVRSLVVARLLARRGARGVVVLGVRAKPEFAAHSWVEYEGAAVLPKGVGYERLKEI